MAWGEEACTLIIVWIVQSLALEININAYLLPLVCAWVLAHCKRSLSTSAMQFIFSLLTEFNLKRNKTTVIPRIP